MRIRHTLTRPLYASVLLLFVASLSPLTAQTEVVQHKRAKRYVDQMVNVEGPVARVRNLGNGSVQIEIGRPYPSSSLVVVIPEEAVGLFRELRDLEGRVIRVYGRVRASLLEKGSVGIVSTDNQNGEPPLLKAPSMVLRERGKLQVLGPAKK